MNWPIYSRWSTGHFIQITAALAGIVLMLLTIYVVFCAEQHPNIRPVRVLFLAFAWAFLPPVWAWTEFFFVFPKWGNPAALDNLKEGQKLSLAIWAPIAISLAAYGSSDYFKKQPKEGCPVTATAFARCCDQGQPEYRSRTASASLTK